MGEDQEEPRTGKEPETPATASPTSGTTAAAESDAADEETPAPSTASPDSPGQGEAPSGTEPTS